MHVWATNVNSTNPADYFVHAADITPSGGAYSLTVQPGYVYTVTTTTGQGKGTAAGPAQGALRLPYSDTFDGDATGTEAKYLMDWQGAFEVAGCGGGRTGQCVRQMSAQAPITWDTLSDPHALIGDPSWSNYTVSSDVLLEQSGYAELLGRANTQRLQRRRRPQRLPPAGQRHRRLVDPELATPTAPSPPWPAAPSPRWAPAAGTRSP